MTAGLARQRAMALIRIGKCRSWNAEGEGSDGWQDKSSAVGWGGEWQNSCLLSASYRQILLAGFARTTAIQPVPAPSLFQDAAIP